MSVVSRRADVVFGTVVFGRMQGVGLDHVMGLVINTLPVRMQVGEEGVEDSVRQMQRLLADLMRHEHASLTLAQRCSGVPALKPLFSALLNFRYSPNIPKGRLAKTNRVWEGVEVLRAEERSNYPVTLSVDDHGEGFSLTAQTLASIDPRRLCEYMSTVLTSLVHALEHDPGRAIGTIELLPAAEREQVLYGWNNTAAAIPHGKCLQELFEEQVERTADAVALVHLDSMLSYDELNRRANRLAHYLRSLGVKPGMRVGICCERGLEMIVALVAILKAGAAYVTLDLNYPVDRLRYMVEDAALATVLAQTDETVSGVFQDLKAGLPIINLTESASKCRNYPDTNLDRTSIGLSSDDLAYVIYTSGSTGRPKASAIPHRAIPGFIFGIDYARFDRETVFLQHSSMSWDALTLELWPVLLKGGRGVLAHQRSLSAGEIGDFISNDGVNTLLLTSALFAATVDVTVETLRGVRYLFTGGETATLEAIQKASEQLLGTRIVNGYGPSECTVFSTCYVVPSELPKNIASVPIGKPIGDRIVYLLDERMDPAPIGVIGEIYIGGPSVPWGYLNQPELTAERFVPDPWGGEDGTRLYRTGDLGKWLGDGTIDFARRQDDQVKIRGFRIELGEIEALLREYDGVRDAVVTAREESTGEKRLVAYYTVARAEETAEGADTARTAVNPEDLRGYLLVRLPEYMVPAAYVCMDRFPLTRNGKLDREALPPPDDYAYAAGVFEPPEGSTEIALASIWATLLNVKRVGRHDNFFALGGHSLLASQLVLRISQVLGVKLDLRLVFEFGQLSSLAECVRRAQFAEFDSEELAQMMRNS
jgi:amino acid adenylation domain-containing protein